MPPRKALRWWWLSRMLGVIRMGGFCAAWMGNRASFGDNQLFDLSDVRHVARFEVGEKSLEVLDEFLLRVSLGLIVGIINPETQVEIAILPIGELERFHCDPN